MRSSLGKLAVLACVSSMSCGDDGSGDDATSGSTSATATGDATSDATSSSGGSSGSTSSDATTITASTSATTTASSTSSDSSGSTGGTGTTGGSICPPLPAGPITPVLVTDIFDGSDDIAFDGQGDMFGRDGDDIRQVDAAGVDSVFVTLPGISYDIRFDQDGNLLVTRPLLDVVTRVTPQGATTDIATGIELANGLHVDSMNRVWITNPLGAEILRVETNGDVTRDVVSGADATAAGGVVLDEDRGLLFYTAYDFGQLRSAPIDAAGNAGESSIVGSMGGRLHGLALDACGNIYAADHMNSDLYRFELDAAGELVGDPILLASFETFVYNVRFGSGAGFSETTLYGAGAPGSIWAVDVGVGTGL